MQANRHQEPDAVSMACKKVRSGSIATEAVELGTRLQPPRSPRFGPGKRPEVVQCLI